MVIAGAAAFVLGLIIFVVWHFFHHQLTGFVRWIRWAELWIDKVIPGVGDNYSVSNDDNIPIMTVGQWRSWLRTAQVQQIDPLFVKTVTLLAVPPMRILFLIVYALMALYVIFFGYGTQYRRRMGLEGLMHEQARSFPAILPFMKFDPRKQPPRAPGMPVPSQLPLFAEALSPEEWVAYHEIPYVGGKLDQAKTWQALTLQLGKRWQGADKLPFHAQGLYAACCLKAARKRKDCETLLNDLAKSWSAEGGFKPSAKLKTRVRTVLKDPKLGGAMQKATDQHAWETTAMLRALQRARQEGGVLAPAEFLWLRGIDRTLWYPMNNLGRKSFHAEAAGAMVHFTNEVIANQRIPTPRFDDVLKALEEFLKGKSAREIPPLDKSAGGARVFKK
jgi:intracellular multiplication protein IcmP